MSRNNRTLWTLFALCVAALGVSVLGCAPKLEVLETADLDQLPALVRVENKYAGYDPDDVLLVLIPLQSGLVRITRSAATVLAVKHPGKDWQIPGPDQLKEIDSIFYTFPLETELEREAIVLPHDLGPRVNLRGPLNLLWFRVGLTGQMFNVEVAFETNPVTIRKVSYRSADNGTAVLLETGATLKVR